MGVSTTEFESFEQQFLELVGEFQSITTSEGRLRESLRSESSRAEAAEAARAAAERSAAEARAAAAAAAAGATQATAALARAHDELTAVKMQAELAVRQRSLLEERCSELSTQLAVCEREVQQLRPLQASHAALQRQYQELQERIRAATDVAKTEASRLESELRRVERCAGGGAEVRERARLAASAHARERRLAAAELQHTTRELAAANGGCECLQASRLESELRRVERCAGGGAEVRERARLAASAHARD
ncbi:unnamed protein product [Plutella xylostella]|uniref:(diamondback moth) hypothetical protein n=1 Tax=Plutella xylostella TaxID=51655 RepID=A0A8S4DGU4_PLUXY|nr:unnamed protein product [Plutella xylostella]